MKNMLALILTLLIFNPVMANSFVAVEFEDGEEIFYPSGKKSNSRVSVQDDCSVASIQKEILSYGHMIKRLGGVLAIPTEYEETMEGYQEFLGTVGVVHFSAKEMGVTDNVKKLKNLGLKI